MWCDCRLRLLFDSHQTDHPMLLLLLLLVLLLLLLLLLHPPQAPA
jgi:hypothetical protein